MNLYIYSLSYVLFTYFFITNYLSARLYEQLL
nr:MAG TPA: hypothetical protein [Caudoviricetes sp.]DAX44043.1 MAG TPA: hypothetical protein [Caudoviricetes sp.]